MRAFLNKIKPIFTGYMAGKAQDVEIQYSTIVLIASLAVPTGAIFAIVNYLYGHFWPAVVLVLSITVLIPCFRLTRRLERLTFARNLLMVDAMITFLALFLDGGIAGVSFMWSLIVPFLAFLLVGLPAAWYWIIGYVILLAGTISAHFSGLIILPYEEQLFTYFPAAFLFFSLVAATFEMHFERLRVRYDESIAELRDLQTHLEENIQHRTHALQQSNEQLKNEMLQHKATAKALKDSEERFYQSQKMETIGTLVGGIAHDFNNMLAGINANLFMIKRKGNPDSETLNRMDNVGDLVMGASDMIRQLLTFARKDKVKFQYFDLTPFLEEAYKLATVSISAQINIRFENNTQDLFVQANGTQLQQVLMNMLNNARDALRNKKKPAIIIKVEKYKPSERFKKANPELIADTYATITIMDNGDGIPADKIDKIFEPFFTTKEVGKGTGLGLAMCYGAIQSHHGTIKVQSEVGKGTAFKIYLPICNEEFAEQSTMTTLSVTIGNGETILFVDDDQKLREAQKEALEMLGYKVIEAKNGKEAVSLFQEHQTSIDLILMNLNMPIMGGVKAAEHIRAIDNNVQIVFLTGYDKDATFEGGFLPSAEELILEKPYTMEKLNRVIQKKLLNTEG